MSYSGNDDALRIPIEIKTEDSKEIRQLINDLADAENDLRGIKPRRGKGTGDATSRSPFQLPEEFGEGIFSGGITQNTPEKIAGKDKTSRQAIQRESEFSKLRDRVNNVEESASNTGAIVGGIGEILGISGLSAKLTNLKGGVGGKFAASGAVANLGKSAVSSGAAIAAGGVTGVIGRVTSFAGKAFLPAAAAIAIFEITSLIVQEMFKPGGLMDRRFKRVINNEIAASAELEEKTAIGQGFKVIQFTTHPSVRGEAGVISSLQRVITNQGVYNRDLQLRGKGVL
jgi:hypothetical protein